MIKLITAVTNEQNKTYIDSNKLPNSSGIYKIVCVLNNKVYIGSSINIRKRIRLHINQLNSQKHANILLQRAWNKYGEFAFAFEILIEVTSEKLIDTEQYFIDEFMSANENYGYNICPRANSTLGVKCSDEKKQKIAKSLMGYKHTEDAKKNIGDSHRGKKYKPMSFEGKKNISESRKGKNYMSQEQIEKMRERMKGNKNLLGHKASEETLIKLRETRKGRRPALGLRCSEENKIKTSERFKGKHLTEEHREKIKESLSGKTKSENAILNCAMASSKYNKEQIIEIFNLRNKGLFYHQIATLMGCTKQTICNIIKGNNLIYRGWIQDGIEVNNCGIG